MVILRHRQRIRSLQPENAKPKRPHSPQPEIKKSSNFNTLQLFHFSHRFESNFISIFFTEISHASEYSVSFITIEHAEFFSVDPRDRFQVSALKSAFFKIVSLASLVTSHTKEVRGKSRESLEIVSSLISSRSQSGGTAQQFRGNKCFPSSV